MQYLEVITHLRYTQVITDLHYKQVITDLRYTQVITHLRFKVPEQEQEQEQEQQFTDFKDCLRCFAVKNPLASTWFNIELEVISECLNKFS